MLSKFFNNPLPTGFTIVELMVAMAIAAILMGMALPAFNTFIEQRTMASRGNDFISAVNLARSEAINRGATVSIQSVNAGDNANEWGNGYCVVVGTPGDCPNDPAVTLRIFDAADGATMDGTGGLNGLGTLTYNGRGMLNLAAQGTIELCVAGVNPGREIAVNRIGRASILEFACP